MPTLSISVSPTDISSLYIDDKLNISSDVYPYPFVKATNPAWSLDSYLDFLIPVIFEELSKGKIEKGTRLLVSSFCDLPNLKTEVASYKLFSEIFNHIEEFSYFYEAGYLCSHNKNVYFGIMKSEFITDEIFDYCSNKAVYPNLIPKDKKLEIVSDFINSAAYNSLNYEVTKNNHIVFSGYRFSIFQNPLHRYIRMLDLIKNPGIYDIRLDASNKLINLYHIKIFDSNLYENVMDSNVFPKVGTLIKAKGPVECLVESNLNTSQLLEVKDDDLLVLPIEEHSEVRLVLKNTSIAAKEIFVRGGSLGLIIDTRRENTDINYYASKLLAWETSVNSVMRDF